MSEPPESTPTPKITPRHRDTRSRPKNQNPLPPLHPCKFLTLETRNHSPSQKSKKSQFKINHAANMPRLCRWSGKTPAYTPDSCRYMPLERHMRGISPACRGKFKPRETQNHPQIQPFRIIATITQTAPPNHLTSCQPKPKPPTENPSS